MCGISAFLSHGELYSEERSKGQDKNLKIELENSLDLVSHRGPDARGRWFSDDYQVGLGHVRLSIIDLSPSGNQPFHDEKGGIHAVVNGELYDHEHYRAQLASEFEFVGNSDCEIVIALYKHYGLSFMSHLRGEFAFVIWDASRQRLIAARDRYGIKSLYYTVFQGKLLVATEMKSFLAFGLQPEWCVRTLRDQSWRVESRTFFKGVYRVLPGHYLICRRNEREEQKPYWDIEYPDKFSHETRSEDEMVEGVRERLLEAVRIRLKADVPVAVYLSGGIDSSSVAGMVAELMKQGTKLGSESCSVPSKMKCFTVQFDEDSGADESEIAQRTAKWLGVDIHFVRMDEEALVSRFEDAVWNSEIPLPDLNGMGRLALAEAVHSQGIKVVVTGEGSDEHFGGYLAFRADSLSEPDYSWPALQIADADREEALRTAVEQITYGIFGDYSPAVPSATMRMLSHSHVTSSIARVGSLPFSDGIKSYGDDIPETSLIEGFNGRVRDNITNRWHPLHTAQYLFMKSFLPHFILRYNGDNIDMVHQVESRCPFLDHHLTEYVNNVPPSLKMKYNARQKSFREKYILREAVRPYVTDEVYNISKKAYMGPRRFKLGGPLHRKISHLVTKENVRNLGFLDWNDTEEAVERAFSQQEPLALRRAITVAQFVVLGQRFGVKPAGVLPN
ncbi:asparagine synthase [Microsporum canis CBS 113480]|uniref:Asparagine synthase n=1 Tax=Arthroderma otae (strain ATCC MYA-4605 / CBS 113480) TaxID=554155 RepID=C5G0Y1_ARTOC|nr:asparagine synthase [Microsporum canis CBS 113480]EEQ35784.1 asparagine synthase [Microsporum canis CBS 113480]